MIKVLGAAGSLEHNRDCISLQINQNTIIDAGNIIRPLQGQAHQIEHVLLTHSHFDHIMDLPFLIENHFKERQQPLTIYALQETLNNLKQHLFNDVIWPNFAAILHPTLNTPILQFKALTLGQTISLADSQITAIPAVHIAGACGYVVEQNGAACLISGDTYLNPEMIDTINQNVRINSLIIDVSFPSEQAQLAKTTQHLTPDLLAQSCEQLDRAIDIYPYHLKPDFEPQVTKQLSALNLRHNIKKILQSGDQIELEKQHVFSQAKHFINTQNNSQNQLQALLKTAQALASETHVEKLLELILDTAMELTQADGGTLYRITDNEQQLSFNVVKNRSLAISMGGTNNAISWPNLDLYKAPEKPNEEMVATYCALHKKVIAIDDVYDAPHFNFQGTKEFDKNTGYRSKSMLVIPLLNSSHELIGVLQLLNKQDQTGHTVAFTDADQQHALALAAQAAISLTNTLLIRDLENLFEAILATITKAFDEKCSFTTGHVRQVAELSDIIAKGIDADHTTYPEVQYNKDDLHAIRIAALLHDVGKIATPEFIMQKATKLEKTIDRIDWIADRIEILKRDLYIEQLEQQTNLPEKLVSHTKQAQKQLDEDFAFIKQSNRGEGFIDDSAMQKLAALANLSYQSAEGEKPLLEEDELYNLQTRRGTLNQEERAKIMDHARVSLEILNTLPFPKKYRNVVNIAANHHEKLDGTGYPRGLTAKDISLEDRILILADLYEALSSKDRPYKEPNKLSTIFKILTAMAQDGQIDSQLLRFFYESGTYQAYNQYLQADQVDEFEFTLDQD